MAGLGIRFLRRFCARRQGRRERRRLRRERRRLRRRRNGGGNRRGDSRSWWRWGGFRWRRWFLWGRRWGNPGLLVLKRRLGKGLGVEGIQVTQLHAFHRGLIGGASLPEGKFGRSRGSACVRDRRFRLRHWLGGSGRCRGFTLFAEGKPGLRIVFGIGVLTHR